MEELYLVNLYDGNTQAIFETTEELVAYLKRREEAGTLMGEAAFSIFYGKELPISYYWNLAFGKKE